jgi:hypothetical protein
MVMNTENPTFEPITELALVDVSSMKDSGMQAIVLLARSLGWNVMHKLGQPVVLTSREGVSRRIPTNTSVRASLFQTLLSSVMLHSTAEPSLELMEKIIRAVKPNPDQARRLRLAVGETPQQHAERLANAELAEPAPTGTSVVIEWADPPEDKKAKYVPPVEHTYARERTIEPEPEPVPQPWKREGVAEGPADGGEHGEIVRQGPYLAKSSINSTLDGRIVGRVYTSNTSQEREWSDGYKDYVCNFCGLAFKSARGAGSHKQVHIREGEAQSDSAEQVKQGLTIGHLSPEQRALITTDKLGTRKHPKPEPAPEPEPPVVESESETVEPDVDVIEAIKNLLWPDVEHKAKAVLVQFEELQREHAELQAKYDKLLGDWGALRDLVRGTGE